MNEAFAWLNELIQKVLRFLPKLSIIRSTEGGVAFVRGKPQTVLPGRLYVYWPLWTELYTIPVNRQTIDVRVQAYVDCTGKPLAVGCVVVYDVDRHNPDKPILWADDHDEAIRDITLGAMLAGLHDRTLADIRANRAVINDALRREVRKGLYNSGINVINCFLSDLTPCRPLLLLGTQPRVPADADAQGED